MALESQVAGLRPGRRNPGHTVHGRAREGLRSGVRRREGQVRRMPPLWGSHAPGQGPHKGSSAQPCPWRMKVAVMTLKSFPTCSSLSLSHLTNVATPLHVEPQWTLSTPFTGSTNWPGLVSLPVKRTGAGNSTTSPCLPHPPSPHCPHLSLQ